MPYEKRRKAKVAGSPQRKDHSYWGFGRGRPDSNGRPLRPSNGTAFLFSKDLQIDHLPQKQEVAPATPTLMRISEALAVES
jgi:hypothetical protein